MYHTFSKTKRCKTRCHAHRFSKMTLCPTTWLLSVLHYMSHGSACRGGLSEAQHNAPRQGPALPYRRVKPCNAMQRRHSHKNDAMPDVIANVFILSGPYLNSLTPCLRGEVSPWGTIPLNNSPFLTALENAICWNHRFTKVLAMFLRRSDVLRGPQR